MIPQALDSRRKVPVESMDELPLMPDEGAIWHGVSPAAYRRLWQDILDRTGGSVTFRFFLQPTMAAIATLHDGIKDVRAGRSPFFWTLLSNPAHRNRARLCAICAPARPDRERITHWRLGKTPVGKVR
jgi:hypothetical protein